MPVKLNKQGWPRFLGDRLPSADDPKCLIEDDVRGDKFSAAASVFKFGETFKTTENSRYPLTLEILGDIDYPYPPVVLDIGASVGITSLDFINRLDFQRYYVTDLHLDVYYEIRHGKYYYYDAEQNCILVVTKRFVIYADIDDAIFPFNWIARHRFSKSAPKGRDLPKINLIHPALKQVAGDVVIRKYDVFTKWSGEKTDLVIAANILLKKNFTDDYILIAVQNIFDALKKPGRFVVVDNQAIEKSSIFYVTDDGVTVEKDINGGAEIRELILGNF